MKVDLQDIGRRFNQGWIFRNLSASFRSNEHVVIKGANGSGKSTLLQIIFGSLTSSEGKVNYKVDDQDLDLDSMIHKVTMCAPYLQLIEEFTLKESIEFQGKAIPFREGLESSEIVELMELAPNANKQIKSFSSGMKQRAKLALAILADVPLVLLDEPAMNLDTKAINWYVKLVELHCQDRLFIVCSNSAGEEFPFCTKELDVTGFK
ncbi:MAG: ABC-type multidrug transport system ATPase subunit [Granulosicoccus sp.]|jgi:ABC-type multidrug transport system ATPase subunit